MSLTCCCFSWPGAAAAAADLMQSENMMFNAVCSLRLAVLNHIPDVLFFLLVCLCCCRQPDADSEA
jgi:hypothetical protein